MPHPLRAVERGARLIDLHAVEALEVLGPTLPERRAGGERRDRDPTRSSDALAWLRSS